MSRGVLCALAALLGASGCAKHDPVEITSCAVRAVHAKGVAPYLAYTISLRNTTDKIIEQTLVQYGDPGGGRRAVYDYRTPLDANGTQTVMFATNGMPAGVAPRSGPLECRVVAVHYRT